MGHRLVVVAILVPLAACSGSSEPLSTTPSAESMESPVPRVPVRFPAPDGVRIEGSVFGNGSVGVVLGHGSDGDQTEWWNVAETLARSGYEALAIDYRSYCPGGEAGCSGDGSTADAWKDMLGGVRYLKRNGVSSVVLMGSSMGGTASVVAAAQPDPGVAGVISLSGAVECCGMDAGKHVIRAIDVPMLFVAGRFDAGFVGSTRRWGLWAGNAADAVVVESGEHGVDFFRLATPDIQQRVTRLVLDFLDRLKTPTASIEGEWRRLNSCPAFVAAFEEAGLKRLTPEWLVTAGYFDYVDEVGAKDPCAGATEDHNSYFFQATGRFGSLDQDGVLVDDGMYRIVDPGTIAFVGPATERDFLARYRIDGADTLSFHVMAPDPCTGSCLEDYAWVISAFYPGDFTRVR
jgi:dienelactone hydrolase